MNPETEIRELRQTIQSLAREVASTGMETRWAAWLSFVVLCVIAWRVW